METSDSKLVNKHVPNMNKIGIKCTLANFARKLLWSKIKEIRTSKVGSELYLEDKAKITDAEKIVIFDKLFDETFKMHYDLRSLKYGRWFKKKLAISRAENLEKRKAEGKKIHKRMPKAIWETVKKFREQPVESIPAPNPSVEKIAE